jgi:hypothetical protein
LKTLWKHVKGIEGGAYCGAGVIVVPSHIEGDDATLEWLLRLAPKKSTKYSVQHLKLKHQKIISDVDL